jgi:hypothetical protein
MSHEFTLVLPYCEVTDDLANAVCDAGLDDGTVSTSQGVTRIDITREADTLESAIRFAIGQVNAAGLAVATVEIEADRLATQSVS